MASVEDFEAWARAAVPMLHARACLLAGDPHGGEDLVQETLVKMFVSWSRIDLQANVDGYAMRTLYHLFVSRWRRRNSRETVSDSLPELLLTEGNPDDRIDLHTALGTLKPAERALIVSRFVNDLSVAGTAELLGRTEGWVKVTTARTLAKLRMTPHLSDRHS